MAMLMAGFSITVSPFQGRRPQRRWMWLLFPNRPLWAFFFWAASLSFASTEIAMPKRSHRTDAHAATLAIVTLFIGGKTNAISLDDIQLWTGSGTNEAALVIEWNAPLIFNYTTAPAPLANKTMVWGYRFNGTATGTQMLQAIA